MQIDLLDRKGTMLNTQIPANIEEIGSGLMNEADGPIMQEDSDSLESLYGFRIRKPKEQSNFEMSHFPRTPRNQVQSETPNFNLDCERALSQMTLGKEDN